MYLLKNCLTIHFHHDLKHDQRNNTHHSLYNNTGIFGYINHKLAVYLLLITCDDMTH